MSYQIAQASIVEWAREYAQGDGPRFHAALMDAPYEIAFMSKGWDNSGIAFQVDTWRAIYDVLLPGAFMFVFGGSRTVHRMAVAIEDAGFRMHPMMVHLQAQGFPKATRIDTQIDNAAGVEREVVGHSMSGRRKASSWNPDNNNSGVFRPNEDGFDTTAPATPLAQTWEGHRYGGQALSPSAEFIICAQRPYEGRPVDDITTHGSGALNIEAGRLPTDDNLGRRLSAKSKNSAIAFQTSPNGAGSINDAWKRGRWPSNVALTHAPDCTPSHCSDGCAVAAVSQQSEGTRASKPSGTGKSSGVGPNSWFTTGEDERRQYGNDTTNNAARFFHNSDHWLETLERIHATDPFLYTPKADKFQREAGLVGTEATTVTDGRETPIDNAYQRGETKRRNTHVAVKPIALTHWLASLLLPPDAYAPRRLLVPFSGSGSEMIGAALAGFEHIQGVEIMPEYIEIARRRLDFWQDYAGMDYDTAREYAVAKQEQLERDARMNAPLDDLPLFGGGTK